MSNVTAVTLLVSSAEDEEVEDGPLVLIRPINAWLTERGFPELASLERHYGGGKHPQIRAFGVALNGFGSNAKEFAGFVLGLNWQCPKEVILVVHDESDDGAKVARWNMG